jgi:hypothetical protein
MPNKTDAGCVEKQRFVTAGVQLHMAGNLGITTTIRRNVQQWPLSQHKGRRDASRAIAVDRHFPCRKLPHAVRRLSDGPNQEVCKARRYSSVDERRLYFGWLADCCC